MDEVFHDYSDDDYLYRYIATCPHSLYIHIPFCVKKCNYCDFTSWSFDSNSSIRSDYTQALVQRLDELKQIGLLKDVKTCYIGGGTPTVLQEDLLSLAAYIGENTRLDEWTVEANPDSLTPSVLDNLYTYGVSRLSIGVQSFNQTELEFLGRIHSSQQAIDAIERSLELPYRVSLDLMCAFPYQTDQTWIKTLETAIYLNPHHISCYPLQIEDGTVFANMLNKGEISDVEQQVEANRMVAARDLLEEAGYRRYEVASYARDDAQNEFCSCQHNISYWSARSYLGIGVGASSMLTPGIYKRLYSHIHKLPKLPDDVYRIRLQITSSLSEFLNAKSLNDLSYDLEFLTYSQALAEDMMLACRMSDGIHPSLLAESKRQLGDSLIQKSLDAAHSQGLAIFDEDGFFKPTQRGWLMGNELYGIFWNQVPQDTRLASI